MTARLFFSATAALTLATSLASAMMLDYSQTGTAQPQQASDQERLNLPPEDQVAPPAGPRLGSWGALDLGISFIYWNAKYSSGELVNGGYLGVDQPLTFGDSLPRGKVVDIGSAYAPGFKARIGWIAPSNNWEIFAEYTWRYQSPHKVHAKASSNNPNLHASDEQTSFLEAAGIYLQYTPTMHSATSEWYQHFNVLDFMLSTNFYITRTLNLQPMLGLKTYDIITNQTYEYRYLISSALYAGSNYRDTRHEKALGIGPRLGFKSLWNFNRNWGINGGLFFSIPWSYFQEKRLETFNFVGTSTYSPLHSLGKKEHSWQSVMEYQLGLTYQAWFRQEKYQLTIQAGWELQLWGANRIITNNGSPGGFGMLSLNGFTASASLAF
jgi:hypothetical protein